MWKLKLTPGAGHIPYDTRFIVGSNSFQQLKLIQYILFIKTALGTNVYFDNVEIKVKLTLISVLKVAPVHARENICTAFKVKQHGTYGL